MGPCCSDDDDDDDDDVWLLIPLFREIQALRVNQGREVLKDGKWVMSIISSLPSKHVPITAFHSCLIKGGIL